MPLINVEIPRHTEYLNRSWYEHPKEIYCVCGFRLIGHRRHKGHYLETSYTCEQQECMREVVFRCGLDGSTKVPERLS